MAQIEMGKKNKRGLKIDGWLNIDKETAIGSTDVVRIVKRIFNAQKVGHAGTLDPMASGILPIALGEATKTIPYIQNSKKIYEFTVKFGEATNTDDANGDIIDRCEVNIQEDDIKAVLTKFIGKIKQVPPQFSAIRIEGKRAYDIARAGDIADIKAREVEVFSLEYKKDSFNGQQADFTLCCGKGTYVRAIARDMAKKLGTVGHVTYLRRTAVGVFTEKNAIKLANLEKILQDATPDELILPVVTALDDIPALPLTIDEAQRLRNGQAICFFSKTDIVRLEKLGLIINANKAVSVKAMFNDELLAIAEIQKATLKPIRVFNR